jgi:hypothetical protein
MSLALYLSRVRSNEVLGGNVGGPKCGTPGTHDNGSFSRTPDCSWRKFFGQEVGQPDRNPIGLHALHYEAVTSL